MRKKVLIYGAGDFGRILKNLIRYTDYEFLGFISDISEGESILGSFEDVKEIYSTKQAEIVMGIGYTDLKNRWKLYNDVKSSGYKFASVIHPNSYICDTALIDEGAIIMSGVNIDFNAKVGTLSVLWPGTVISHDSVIGNNSFISPNATVCGFSSIGNNCFIGANSVVVDHTDVPNDVFIKANQIVKNVANNKSQEL
ncbi:MAG: DapH/DapD/GlmU-related protein [Ignavibacteriae bacterium]|nr:DapH/DapD/GlmU-related protein [Ignavibacteriota bacterium]